ncbi:MAG: hypothetical protein V1921_01575 [Candidatus Altiarchaeota archaeon]
MITSITSDTTTYYLGKDYEVKEYANETVHNTVYYYANNELVGRMHYDVHLIMV